MPQVFPKYVCHKEVRAVKIQAVERRAGKYFIVPADPRFEAFEVTADFIDKRGPIRGGYYVVYRDGYASYSPAEAFEAGYDLVAE